MLARRKHLSPRVVKRVRRIKQSLWLLPLSLALLGVVLGALLPWLDHRLSGPTDADDPGLLARFAPAPSPAESLVSTSVGALTTIFGVAFSLTVVTLQLAAVQYTSRVMRRFMADRTTQLMLGAFVGTIAFQLLLLRSIQPGETGSGFVPPLSMALAMVLSLACLGLLAFFLHHLARSIQAATLIASVGKETITALDRLGINAPGGGRTDLRPPPDEPRLLVAQSPGYVQLVDEELLLDAPPGCTFLRVEARTGHFVLPGQPLLSVWMEGELSPRDKARLGAAFALGRERTTDQDMLFGVRQLVDVALKALSPGINDATTALMVVNELAAVGYAVATSHAGPCDGYRARQRGPVTVLLPRIGMQTFLQNAFSEIPHAALGHPRLLVRLLEVLAQMAELTPDEAVRGRIVAFGEALREELAQADVTPHTRRVLDERLETLEHPESRPSREVPNTL
jgi:uncharacterized membrane protein